MVYSEAHTTVGPLVKTQFRPAACRILFRWALAGDVRVSPGAGARRNVRPSRGPAHDPSERLGSEPVRIPLWPMTGWGRGRRRGAAGSRRGGCRGRLHGGPGGSDQYDTCECFIREWSAQAAHGGHRRR